MTTETAPVSPLAIPLAETTPRPTCHPTARAEAFSWSPNTGKAYVAGLALKKKRVSS